MFHQGIRPQPHFASMVTVKKQLRGAIKKKMSQIVEKVHNFLDPPPPPRMIWTFLNLGKKMIFDDPTPPRPKLGKIWNVDYFDIVAPPLTLAKTVPKSYQTDIWGLFYAYIGHICTKCCIYLTNISPIYHKNQGHISVIWIWEKFVTLAHINM